MRQSLQKEGSEMRLVIQGCPITKKNSQRIVLIGGHPKIIPSKQYKTYEDAALYQMSTKRPSEPIRDPVNVGCVYYMPTRRRVDLVNLLEATMDILVKAKILEDDNANIVAGHDGSAVRYDKANPRAEVEIGRICDEQSEKRQPS